MKKLDLFIIIFSITVLILSSYYLFEQFYQIKVTTPKGTNWTPADRISDDQIKVYDDEVIIKINNTKWSGFKDTNSMLPTFDWGHHVLTINVTNPSELVPGDIIAFKYEHNESAIHRIILTGTDDEGWYAITKGDNIKSNDPGKVRFENITKVVVAIFY